MESWLSRQSNLILMPAKLYEEVQANKCDCHFYKILQVFTCQYLVPMQQHKPDHPCPQAVPVLPQEAIFDEPDQIPKPVGEKYHMPEM